MALSSLRLCRPLQSASSSLINLGTQFSATTVISSSSSFSSATVNSPNPRFDLTRPHHHDLPFQSRCFRSSSAWLSSARSSFGKNNFNDEISPDTILFEGCDYNHWLITMDFPKDPVPTRDEMIETYLQTLAKVVGSYEEAKKKMYAFSTTTYVGFQCLVTEEMSEKFKELPGVVFVLPDSYIDPVAKEYGGDKYENGVITPRPPPVQRGRGRYGDGNREVNRRPRGPMPDQLASPSYGNQGPFYMDRNTGQQQNPALQPSPVAAGDRRDQMPQHQPTYGQNQQGHYNPQGGRIQPEQRDYLSPRQNDFRGDNMNYSPSQSGNYRQGGGGNYGQMARPNYGQGAGGNYEQEFGKAHRQEIPMAGGNYGQGAGGNYGQGVGSVHRQETPRVGGNYGQGAGGSYGQGSPIAGGNYGQGAGGSYGEGAPIAGGNYGQVAGGSYGEGAPMAGGNCGQGAGGNYGQGVGSAHRQEIRRGGENYGQGAGGNYGQRVGVNHLRETPMASVNHGQGAGGNFGQRVGASHRQEMGSGYGQSYPGHGGEHMQVENRNYEAIGNTGADQGTY